MGFRGAGSGVSDIPMFASKGWYRVRGRGWVAVIYCDRERDRADSGLAGAPVYVDGEQFMCLAVECHPKGGPIRQGEEIGLLVRETPT